MVGVRRGQQDAQGVGTDYDASPEALNRSGGIKYQITQSTDPGVCFSDVHVLDLPEGRVIMFEIPAAPKGIPIAWKGHYYSRSKLSDKQ